MTSGQLKILICSSLENLGKKSECGSLFEAVGVNEISQGERREAEASLPPFSKRDVDLVFLHSSLTFAKRSQSGN